MRTFRVTDGRQIRAVRAIMQMTQRDFSTGAGVHRSSVLRLEKQGRLPPRSWAAERVAKFAAENGVVCDIIEGSPAVIIGVGEPAEGRLAT